jgi:tetratricopeptide (TPR) repeat protein
VTEDSAGDRIAGYQIERVLGRGGWGVVYLARDPLRGPVALKVMSELAALDEGVRLRFQREFRAAARLDHPGIVRVYDSGVVEGTPYIVMEYIEGVTLTQHFAAPGRRMTRQARVEPSRLERICDAMVQILSALDYIHGQRLIHQDLKPENILVTPEGRVRLVDFGLARAWTVQGRPGRRRPVIGSLTYMSPEQLAGARVLDPRADLYALGVILYELLCGRLPFHDRPRRERLRLRTVEDPPPIETVNPLVPRDLARLVHHLLRRRPDERPVSAREVARLLLEAGRVDEGLLRRWGLKLSAPPALRTWRPHFVGRERELRRLLELAECVRGGGLGIAVIHGESGIGKTRLIQEFLDRLDGEGWRVLWPRTVEAGLLPMQRAGELVQAVCRQLPEGPEGEVDGRFRPYMTQLRPLLEADGACLQRVAADRPPPGVTPDEQRRRMAEFFCNLLVELGQEGPLLIVLDDLHTYDEESRRFLRWAFKRLNARCAAAPVGALLVAAEDRGWQPRIPQSPAFAAPAGDARGVADIPLAGLGSGEVETLVCGMLGIAAVPEEVVEQLARESRGNPYVLRELVNVLHEEGKLSWLTNGAGSAPGGGPEEKGVEREVSEGLLPRIQGRLSELAARRMGPLPEVVREVLDAAAVIGNQFEFPILVKVADRSEEECLDALDYAMRHELVEELDAPDVRFAFRHPVFRLGLLDALDGQRKKLLHRRAFKTIRTLGDESRPEVLARLALHSFWGEDAPRAIRYNHRYVQRHGREMTPEARIYYEQRVLDLLARQGVNGRPEPELIRLEALATIAAAHRERGALREAESAYRELLAAAKRARAADWHVRATRDLGRLFQSSGRGAAAEAVYRSALETARSWRLTAEEAEILLLLAANLADRGLLLDARLLLSRALALFQERRDRERTARTQLALADVALQLRKLTAARNLYEAALDAFDPHDHPGTAAEITAALGEIQGAEYRFSSALAAFGRALDIVRHLELPASEALVRLRFARVLLNLARHAQARDMAAQGVDLSRPLPGNLIMSRCLLTLGRIHLAQANPGEARSYFQQSHDLSREEDRLPDALTAAYGMAEIDAILDPERALAATEALEQEGSALQLPRLHGECHLARARIYHTAGRYEESLQEYELLLSEEPQLAEDPRLLWTARQTAELALDYLRMETLEQAAVKALHEVRRRISSADRRLLDVTPPFAAILSRRGPAA